MPNPSMQDPHASTDSVPFWGFAGHYSWDWILGLVRWLTPVFCNLSEFDGPLPTPQDPHSNLLTGPCRRD